MGELTPSEAVATMRAALAGHGDRFVSPTEVRLTDSGAITYRVDTRNGCWMFGVLWGPIVNDPGNLGARVDEWLSGLAKAVEMDVE